MVETRSVAKRQKTEECTSCMESVLFNNDSLFQIASYLPAEDLLKLALTCRRFGIAPVSDGDDGLSLVEETARRIVQDVATEEQINALPRYDNDYNWLCKYNYLQSLRVPLIFDQLVGTIEYVEGNKSRVVSIMHLSWATAISNNIMMAGKHYVSFEAHHEMNGPNIDIGVMRPGEAMQSANGFSPLISEFFNQFTQTKESQQYNNSVNCCMYDARDGQCCSSAWEGNFDRKTWEGMAASLYSPYKIGMLLDLDEGTLSVYKNDRRLGVMKRGLAGHYCWVVSMLEGGTQVTIKRGTVPTSLGQRD